MNFDKPERKENNAILKKVNRVSSGRRKAGIDGVKIAIIMVLLMAAIAVLLIFIGNLELPQLGQGNNTTPVVEEVIPEIIINPFIGIDSVSIDLPEGEEYFFYHKNDGTLELPINGATGWVAVAGVLRDAPSAGAYPIMDMAEGQVFVILEGQAEWWHVALPDGTSGWVDNRRCFINLPDVVPSVIFDIHNAEAARFRTGGHALAGVTGVPLYEARAFNYRLGRYEFMVPGMYSMARGLHNAQQRALAHGETIVVHEAFRPRSTQLAVVNAINAQLQANPSARAAIDDSPWTLTWFISAGTANHQRGGALDASLARVVDYTISRTGAYAYLRITNHVPLDAGSPLHELSPASAIVQSPRGMSAQQVLSGNIEMTGPGVNAAVLRMQYYFAGAGFNPLASLWWHFDHQPSISLATTAGILGEFYVADIQSVSPQIGN